MGCSTWGPIEGEVLVVPRAGELVRELKTDGPVSGNVAATASGDVLVPSEDGSIYAFDARGALLWKTKTTSAIDSSPAFGRDHLIFFGAFDHAVHAVGADGAEPLGLQGGRRRSTLLRRERPDGRVWFGSGGPDDLRTSVRWRRSGGRS